MQAILHVSYAKNNGNANSTWMSRNMIYSGGFILVFLVIHFIDFLCMDTGPDFFNAQLSIGTQMWAGNVEIHVKSSDWYVHHHETDAAYDNVILHVVWEHNMEIYRCRKNLNSLAFGYFYSISCV